MHIQDRNPQRFGQGNGFCHSPPVAVGNIRVKIADIEILVQMEKEAIREKEPVFTMNLSLAGKYSVVTNANTTKSVSSKLGKQDRERLRECIPSECEYGIVIRTNAKELLQRDDLSALETECSQLIMQMDKLLREGIHRTCYSQVYQAPASYL